MSVWMRRASSVPPERDLCSLLYPVLYSSNGNHKGCPYTNLPNVGAGLVPAQNPCVTLEFACSTSESDIELGYYPKNLYRQISLGSVDI